jgi:hypothetical protein
LCFPRDFHFGLRILKRLLRTEAKEVIFNEKSGRLYAIRNGRIYRLKDNNIVKLGELRFDAPLFNSHCVLNGKIYFGQYDRNTNRRESNIFSINEEDKLSVAYTFSPREIRHVHSVTMDPFINSRIWVTTGDENGECRLLFTDDEFKNLKPANSELTQDYRVVNLGFTKDYLFYGTDSLIGENSIFIQYRSSARRINVKSLKQTAWFLKQDENGNAVLGTTVENGPGCSVRYGSLMYTEDDGLTWNSILNLYKDNWPMPLFKWGSFSFSNGHGSLSDLYINVDGFKHLDGCSVPIKYILEFDEDDLRRIEVLKEDYFRDIKHKFLVVYLLNTIYRESGDLRYLNTARKVIDMLPKTAISTRYNLRKTVIK